jgi:hypothetical protein
MRWLPQDVSHRSRAAENKTNPVMPSYVNAKVVDQGATVEVSTKFQGFELPAQEAYDLYQALGAVLPECVQPFQPYPRD